MSASRSITYYVLHLPFIALRTFLQKSKCEIYYFLLLLLPHIAYGGVPCTLHCYPMLKRGKWHSENVPGAPHTQSVIIELLWGSYGRRQLQHMRVVDRYLRQTGHSTHPRLVVGEWESERCNRVQRQPLFNARQVVRQTFYYHRPPPLAPREWSKRRVIASTQDIICSAQRLRSELD